MIARRETDLPMPYGMRHFQYLFFTACGGRAMEQIPVGCGKCTDPVRASGGAPSNDSWIAATAIVYGIPVVTQDAGYDAMQDVQVIEI